VRTRAPLVYVTLFFLSASILCFEVVCTRIASVIFVQDYAYMILSLALLGLGGGGVASYYRIGQGSDPAVVVRRSLFLLGLLLCVFVVAVVRLSVTNPFVFLFLVFLPFCAAGVVYAQTYRTYSSLSFRLYTADVSGAAAGSLASLGLIGAFGAPNGVLVLALVVFALSALLLPRKSPLVGRITAYASLAAAAAFLTVTGRHEFLGSVPIGNFPEKDFHHVYPGVTTRAAIIDSRWSIYGRADLVQYSHQDMVRQLFIDGAAGSQVYRFNGNVGNTQSILQQLLLQHTNAIPFLCLNRAEKRSMLVLGPGGGKEVLLGLFGDVDTVTAVEVNPDFVRMVRDQKNFDGGIYSDFPNVKVLIEEGRHFVKQTRQTFDLIVMALPSTAQMQNIEPFATSENFLLTKEAIADYLERLTPEGRLILTVHNGWELKRLTSTAVAALVELGESSDQARNHFAAFEAEYAPTVVIKKSAFTPVEARRWMDTCAGLPPGFHRVTSLPFGMTGSSASPLGQFLAGITRSPEALRDSANRSPFDISACTDDRPYFYKIDKGIPAEILFLLVGTAFVNFFLVWLPWRISGRARAGRSQLALPLAVLMLTGTGFMVLEVSLFQKLVLYLGSPTISLSILLCSLLAGMGIGSTAGRNLFGENVKKRLAAVSVAIVALGVLILLLSPVVLATSHAFDLPLRAGICFLLIFPLACALGIPFPSGIQLMTQDQNDRYIPWMYGVNGSMSVLGSVLAIALSMVFGFTASYAVGLACYAGVGILAGTATGKRPGSAHGAKQ
jgi:hypothetical protein